ncbi:uncharacterized protein LOC128581137 [Nycticebus coucang]|uniref:uncharacterized protein LOC128581137 n=1 Tax=Nycticebus coucang TaxID=9470 RepID=UPI00234CE9AB|nr:uncharacterized protein LOC128581137 [Nycticebus coucang]
MAASEGSERLGTRRPGSGPRWNGVGAAAWAVPPASRKAARPLRALAPRSQLTRSRGARCGFSSSFASSTSSGFFFSSSSSFFSSSSSSSSSFPTSSRSATASSFTTTSTTTTPSGAPESLQSPGPRRLRCGPLDPEPAAPKLIGQTDKRTTFLTPNALPCCHPQPRVLQLGSPLEHLEENLSNVPPYSQMKTLMLGEAGQLAKVTQKGAGLEFEPRQWECRALPSTAAFQSRGTNLLGDEEDLPMFSEVCQDPWCSSADSSLPGAKGELQST